MAAAMTQWNILAGRECRGTFSGMQDPISPAGSPPARPRSRRGKRIQMA